MAWIYLAESAESVSHSNPGCEPSLTVKRTDTLKVCSCREWLVENSTVRPFGMTSPHSEKKCCQTSISFLEVSHARTLALQAAEQAWRESEADFFSKSQGWLMRFDPASYSWKTFQLSLLEDSTESQQNFPSFAMIVDGQLCQPQNLGPVISASVGSCLPTPRANDSEKRGDFDPFNQRNGPPAAAKLLPTPTATPYGYNQSDSLNAARRMSLDSMASRGVLPTPMARDWKGSAGSNRQSPDLSLTMGGSLNPQFVEELMGFRIGWTELSASVIQWFRCKSEKLLKESSA